MDHSIAHKTIFKNYSEDVVSISYPSLIVSSKQCET